MAPRFRKPEKRYEAGKNSDIIEVTCIWADLDFKSARAAPSRFSAGSRTFR